MVHIPFFGIEFPEPRVLEIVPDVVVTLIRLCSRALDATMDAIYPLSPEQADDLAAQHVKAIPREFDRVIKRRIEGKIKNNEQLSSELEDASYDYYRRLLRTSIVGGSDEAHEDVMARQLYGEALQPRLQVLQAYKEEHPEAFLNTEDGAQAVVLQAAAASTSSSSPQAAAAQPQELALLAQQQKDDLRRSIQLMRAQAGVRQRQLDSQQSELTTLRRRALTSMAQSARAATNAGLGVALSLALFKGLTLSATHLVKLVRRARKKLFGGAGAQASAAAGARTVGRPGRATSGSGAPERPAATPTGRGAAPARQETRQQQQQQTPAKQQQQTQQTGQSPAAAAAGGAAAGSRAASAAATPSGKQGDGKQQQQQQQSSAEQSPATARRARPTTRTR